MPIVMCDICVLLPPVASECMHMPKIVSKSCLPKRRRQHSEMRFCEQGWLHSILYVLFENAMSVVKLWAVIAGGSPCIIVTPYPNS